jgi:hypothetical protein
LAAGARADVERFAVIIGNNAGNNDEIQLRYAESDADKISDVLKNVGGFSPENVIVIKAERAPAIERAIIATNDRVRAAITRPHTQAMLFVYFSGHADGSTIHLSGSALDLSIVEQLVRSSAARFRVLVLDACRSGVLTRVKGGTPAPPFLAKLEAQLDSEGAVFLTSSSSNEDAQESDELRGSFLTHYLRSALLGAGDDDGDGKVTLEEAYRYAYLWTLNATSRTWAGTQHPTFQYDVRGQGAIVITEPRAHQGNRATVAFPGPHDYLVMLSDSRGAVVGEVVALAAGRSLNLKPGRYFVRGRAKDHLLEGEVTAEAGQTTEVRDNALQRVEYARLVRKGGDVAPAHGPEVAYVFHTPLRNADTLCSGMFAGYRFTFPVFDLSTRIEACRARFENSFLRASTKEFAVSMRLAFTHDFQWFTLGAGVSAGPALFRQDFETRGVAPPRTTWALHLGLTAGVSVDLPLGFNVFVEEAFRTYLLSFFDGRTERSSLEPSLAFQQAIGVNKLW